MMNSRKSIPGLLIALFALALLPASAAAAPKVDGVFPVAGVGANNKIVEGPEKNMWVTVSAEANDVARITPSGEVEEFELKQGLKEVNGASGIAKDAEGHLWVTGEAGNEGVVVKFSPSNLAGTTVITEIPQIKVPFSSLVLGPDKMMWVATEGFAIRFPPASADPDADKKLIPIGELAPRDIDVAGPLLAISDTKRIVTLTTDGAEKSYDIDGTSQGVAGGQGGQIAYSEPLAEPQAVGLITPPNRLKPIPTPAPGGDPFGVTVGSDGAFWFVMGAFNTLARLEPGGTQLTFIGGLPKEGLSRQIGAGPSNTLWVTVSKAEFEAVARVTGLEPPGSKPGGGEPRTAITKGPKGKVKTKGKRARVVFGFSSPDAGTSFECRLMRVAGKGKKAKTPQFAACKSPKTYRLVPGRYRFEVRAMLAGVADKSPETRSFRVVHVGRHRHR